jgi:DNA-nicking Smr family endonuclease
MPMKRKKFKQNPFMPLNFFVPEDTLDYHEYGILDRFDIEKIFTEFIEDCYFNKNKKVLIITGKGIVIRPIIQKLIKSNKYVEESKIASYGNTGAFEVILKN